MKAIHQTYTIDATAEKVWQALINPDTIAKWGGGPAQMSDEVGYGFKLWGGDIYGKNLEVVPSRLLTQEWSDGTLKTPTSVCFELESEKDRTVLHLTQSGVPEDRLHDLDDGWRTYYLGPLKILVEKGEG